MRLRAPEYGWHGLQVLGVQMVRVWKFIVHDVPHAARLRWVRETHEITHELSG